MLISIAVSRFCQSDLNTKVRFSNKLRPYCAYLRYRPRFDGYTGPQLNCQMHILTFVQTVNRLNRTIDGDRKNGLG